VAAASGVVERLPRARNAAATASPQAAIRRPAVRRGASTQRVAPEAPATASAH
jgi:hypothetical protein